MKKRTIQELMQREDAILKKLTKNTDMPMHEWNKLANELNNVRAMIEDKKQSHVVTNVDRKRYEVKSYSYLNI